MPFGPRVALAELRDRRHVLQRVVAQRMGTQQPHVSKVEGRSDHRVSTLAQYVRALGGELRLVAEFGDRTYEIDPSGDANDTEVRYRVIWQDPASRAFRQVGYYGYDGRSYMFAYDVRPAGPFVPFPAFPDLTTIYRSAVNWGLFTEATVSSAHSGISGFLGDGPTAPVAVELDATEATNGGVVQLIPVTPPAADGTPAADFLVSGVRHAVEEYGESEERIRALRPGDALELRRDFAYDRAESHARMLHSRGVPVGWFPDYDIAVLDELERNPHAAVAIDVIRVLGPDANPHLRITCRLRAAQRR